MSPFHTPPNPAIVRELGADERVLWSGQPDPSRMKQKVMPTALLSIPVGVFVAFWIWSASESLRGTLAVGRTPSIIEVVWPAFGLLGAALVVFMARTPMQEHAKAARTFHALTDKRALIVVEGRKHEVQSVLPTEFCLEHRDLPTGKGDVVLKRETKGAGEERTTTEYGFFGIMDAREVERIARELAQGAR